MSGRLTLMLRITVALSLSLVFSDAQIESCNATSSYFSERQRGFSAMQAGMEVLPNQSFVPSTKTVILNQKDPQLARQSILRYFLESYDLFTSLYDVIKPCHFWARGDPLRHPVGWYVGHSSVFYVNKLRLAGVIKEPIHGHFESLFAVGVDEMSWDDKLEDRDTWPPREDVYAYRQQIRDFVSQTIQELSLELPIRWESPWWAILMGIEHDRIHLETSSLLLRQLPLEAFVRPLPPGSVWANECRAGVFANGSDFEPQLGAPGHAPKNELLAVEAVSDMEYGREINNLDVPGGNIYGWDTEFGAAIVRDVPAFNASKFLVSNEEFLEFVLDGGYEEASFWTEEGWNWVQSTNTTQPKFWIKNEVDDKIVWRYRTMLDVVDLPWNWPVIVNQLEGEAFTTWKGLKSGQKIRLITEDEYYAIRKGLGLQGKQCKVCNEDLVQWEGDMEVPGNLNLEYYASEAPVDMFEFGSTGFFDIIGNVWQHTMTPLHLLEGFSVHPFYDDYTYPFVDNMHNMIKGGAWISSGTYGGANTRNWFRRHFFQIAGIRYVESDRDLSFLSELAQGSSALDANDDMINKYTHLHYYNEPYFGVPNFAKQVADIAIKHTNTSMRSRALDVGCATGRTSYELAKVFDHVTGLDCTTRLIGVGYRLAEQGFLEWDVTHHGDIKQRYKVTLSELGIDHDVVNKVYFAQEDAENLDLRYSNYDLVVASNLIDELANPLLFLTSIKERVNANGKLVLLSPYDWTQHKTLPEMWIGGKYLENEAVNAFDAIKQVLEEWFVLESEEEVEMVQRETNRTFQHAMLHCTVWKRR